MHLMNMKSIHLTLASAPALVMFRGFPEDKARQGTILFYHSFGASKETYVSVLQHLAEAGFLVVGIDGIGHGSTLGEIRTDFEVKQRKSARMMGIDWLSQCKSASQSTSLTYVLRIPVSAS